MKKYSFFIPGRLPGLNEIIGEARGNKFASAAQKKKYTKRVADVIRLTFRNYKPLGKVWITCMWVEKDKRRDPDNIIGGGKKFICDGIVKSGLMRRDNWDILGFTDTWEVGEPGVWVTAEEV